MNYQKKILLEILRKLPNSILFWGLFFFTPLAQAQSIQSTLPLNKLLAQESPAPSKLEQEVLTTDSKTPKFGDKGSKRWYIQGAGASTVDNEAARSFVLLGAGISEFFVNGHSINLELNGMSFFQTGDDAVGLNLALLMQWHFYRRDNWSIFVDGGAGVLGSTNNVPSKGTSFNFTPQLGGGTTIRLANDQRLVLGIRWHHISNADLYEDNPGRDSLMGYVGLNLPR